MNESSLNSWLSSTCVAFRGLTPAQRMRAMALLLEQCPPEELWQWQSALTDRLCRDMVGWLPLELAHNILGYLDTVSLFRAARVSSVWRRRVHSALGLWRRQVHLLGGKAPQADLAGEVQVIRPF